LTSISVQIRGGLDESGPLHGGQARLASIEHEVRRIYT
jgi:hypothetical protein